MVASSEQYSPSDIAIVGMALRVPGARNVDEFWSNLRNGVESIRDLTEEELLDAGESATRLHHPNYVRRAAELPAMEMFDADFFGLSPKEAAIMDPQHRQFLECTWEAMEDANCTADEDRGPVGVFAGCGMGSYFYFNVCSNRQLVDQVGMFLLRHTGNDKDFLATRASFLFDLHGPSVNVQTACSTSLVAVHMACQSLLAGECETAIAGGVTIELPHRRGYLFQEGEILSPDGHCRAFDHRAAGTVFGSGVGVVVLKRLSDALDNGDIIHAIVRGTAVNNDGASKATYLAPSVTGQAEAILEAQGLAGVSADSIQYVECHGTGTYLGDPIEIEALTQAFRQSTDKRGFCRVGSVKSNIGHLDTAAGVVSLIKTTLALKHGEIPATLGFEKPNPAVKFADTPFVVNDRLTPWPQTSAPRRAAVNSLGVGGTNAHVVIEAAPLPAARAATADDRPHLFMFSAKHRKPLDQGMVRLSSALAADPALQISDASYTLYSGRKHFEHRRVLAARDRDEAIALLATPETRRAFTHQALEAPAGAVFLFPGGGAQHPGMARSLYKEDAQFRAIVEEALSGLDPAAAAEIRHVWLDDQLDEGEAAARFLKPSIQLPAIFIVEVAVARHWMRHGIMPNALMGHSMGENAAACVAGVISLRDAVQLLRLRGELFDTIPPGGMLSIALAPDALRAMLPPSLDIASVNAPKLCVVSGRNEDLDAFRLSLEQRSIEAVRVPIDIAAHSRMLDAILPRFEAFLRSIRLNAPKIPIISNLTGDWLTEKEARDPAYWARHLRSTVEFGRGAALLAQQPDRVFIEVGPGRTLSSLVKLQPAIAANQVFNSLPHADDDTDDRLHLLTALGRAWALGLSPELDTLWQGSGARRVSLPAYAFNHQRFFIAPGQASGNDQATETDIARIKDIADWGFRPVWRRSVADIAIDAHSEPRSFLIFCDDTGLGAELIASLRRNGHKVISVTPGDTFAQHSAEDYVLCPEDGRAGYDALIAAIGAEGEFPTNIVHLWLNTGEESHRPGSTFFNRLQEQGFYSLLFLAQALDEAGRPEETQLHVVTNGMQRVGDEPLPYPEKATILGPGLTIPKEMAGLSVRLIDLGLAETKTAFSKFREQKSALIEQLEEDLLAPHGSEVLTYRQGRRWTLHHEKLALPEPSSQNPLFRRNGVYLITGGLGDLALTMARHLTERFAANVVLTGRATLPERADWPLYQLTHGSNDRRYRAIEQIEAMEQAGHKVLYVSGDVGNPEDMAGVVAAANASFGPINGVLHAAGLVDDALMAVKSLPQIENVLTPKLHGTMVLDQLFRDVPLDLFVLFSSTSTDTAPAGQVDYVAANAYLNAYAEAQAHRTDRQILSIHWGIWNEIGLAARATNLDTSRQNAPTSWPAKGPFFTHWVRDSGAAPALEVEISPRTHWLLAEHRTASGQAVIPGTGYIEMIAQAANECDLGSGFVISDLVFLAPLAIADGESANLRLRMTGNGSGYDVAIEARSGAGAFVTHAEARLDTRIAPERSTKIDLAGISGGAIIRSPLSAALKSVQDGKIQFGPRWQVLRAQAIGTSEAAAELRLAETFRADLENGVQLHPALLDIATGFAMGLVPEYASSDTLWVPMSYGAIRVHDTLPEAILSHVRLDANGTADGYAAFDITITDSAGKIVLEADRFVMKRLDGGFAAPAPQRARHAEPHEATSSPASQQLAALVRNGIGPQDGFDAMLRAIATRRPQPIISSMDLAALKHRTSMGPEPAKEADAGFERPDLDIEFVAPGSAVEEVLAGFWRELLGIERIGIHDNFFDLGGHSLIAVRLFRMIKKAFSLDLPISVLFEAPTIATCAAIIAAQAPASDVAELAQPESGAKRRLTHLVPMSQGKGGDASPIFICAGMFGNLLNLRQLALQLGANRPVYGLQARGLYGDQEPHLTFEAAASDYLAEIRSVKPKGPYILGGFSGGGLIAYEMAQQLRQQGEEVSLLVMLDTPLPRQTPLSLLDRVHMKLQDVRRHGVNFFGEWLKSRRDWKRVQAEKQLAASQEQSGSQFHNARIEAAFYEALKHYQVKPYSGAVLLLRPRAEVLYRLSGGRRLQTGRNVVLDDNGWSPYVEALDVQEVPGDHDSMVLEPYVRVLASKLKKRLGPGL
ncbi:type I polyketide synthase [Devosia faecipullorum]|uniref:type I polyketide synthase n=1 Tax=Devosia faecipullorum TaxID=2755039 RepID=UPI00187B2ECB|nr:type I polyketide synthase [Devosia faecipullorum]MBE7732885.1 KR domain-containing protein [Devosia faecipullorum]